MAILTWDNMGERRFQTGVSHCVLYPAVRNQETGVYTYPTGVAWNGVTSISETPDGGDAEDFYADNIKYLSLRGVENLNGSINAYTYPDEFMLCDGSAVFAAIDGVYLRQQRRQMFGLSYTSIIGNDVQSEEAFMYHLLYGATVSPSDREYSTVSDSPEPIEFSWDFTTTPVKVGVASGVTPTGGDAWKPVSLITIDGSKLTTAKRTALQDALWGTESNAAYLPLPAALHTLLQSAT